MGMTIISGGPLSTVQDAGRFGYMALGFSTSGAMDAFSFRAANFLVKNDHSEAVIETTMCGFSALFDTPAVIAVTGANIEPMVNGKAIEMNRAIEIRAGDIFASGFAKRGARSYIAVAGGFAISPVLGSRSTNMKAGIGGLHGKKLSTGDEIPFRWTTNTLDNIEKRVFNPADSGVFSGTQPVPLRVVADSQESLFSDAGITAFYSSTYTVLQDSDRMGIRLDGNAVETHSGSDIVSDGIALGAIQVPASGKPIILMVDRQTTGGYAKIGTVISPDICRLAQIAPGGKVCFEKIAQTDAEKEYRHFLKKLKRLKRRLA